MRGASRTLGTASQVAGSPGRRAPPLRGCVSVLTPGGPSGEHGGVRGGGGTQLRGTLAPHSTSFLTGVMCEGTAQRHEHPALGVVGASLARSGFWFVREGFFKV